MLMSSLYSDVVTPIATVLWAEAMYVGLDFPAFVRQAFGRVRGLFGRIDQTLAEWGWTVSARGRPVMLADCLLWEEIDVLKHVFGERSGLDELPTLSRLYAEGPGRAAFQKELASQPAPVTGRGLVAESEIVGRVQTYIAG
jgi:glutathione S-transferase